MSFKDILSKLDQFINEAETKDTATGKVHKGEYGNKYGQEAVRDQYGHKVGTKNNDSEDKKEAPKKGRGRPKKGSDETGEVKKYDWSAFGGGKDVKLPKWDKSKTTKHSLKEYFEKLDELAQPIPVMDQGNQKAGMGVVTSKNPTVEKMLSQLSPQDMQVVMKGQPAQQGQQPQAGQAGQAGQAQQPTATSGGATNQPGMSEEGGKKWIQGAIKHPGAFTAKAKAAGKSVSAFAKEKAHAPGTLGKEARLAQTLSKMSKKKTNEADIPPQDGLKGAGLGAGRSQGVLEGKDEGKPGKNFAKIAKSAGKEYGSKEAGERVAGAVKAKLAKQGKLEETQLDELGRKTLGSYVKKAGKDQQKRMAQTGYLAGMATAGNDGVPPSQDEINDMIGKDEVRKDKTRDAGIDRAVGKLMKKGKKKVKENMDNRLKAAHHLGRAHGLTGQPHCGKNYDDMEEARMYHQGYKKGLDECHGQLPIRGLTGSHIADEGAQGTVDDMASFGAHTPSIADEGNAFTKALAKTPKNGTFALGGQSFKDTSNYDAKVFESWDNQLTSLLEEYQDIQEGISVSVSKGQQGSPDSVSVTAQDGDADKLLALVKSAGLGLFGDEGQAEVGVPSGDEQHGGVNVVGDHDGMMDLIRKATGGGAEIEAQPGTLEPASAEAGDFADEETPDSAEGGEVGNELDMIKRLTQAISGHEEHEHQGGEEGSEESDEEGEEEQVDEVESEDQMEYEIAEDNPPDTGAQEFTAMDQEDASDNASASPSGGATNSNLEENDDEAEDESNDEAEDEGGEECETCGHHECECGEDQDQKDGIEESYANSNDDGFQADIDFMTKIIAGGLNKPKSTGQTTIPVIAGQNDREGYSVNESALADWKTLAGLK